MSKYKITAPVCDNKNIFRDCLDEKYLDYMYRDLCNSLGSSEYINTQYNNRMQELMWTYDYTKQWYSHQ